MQGCEPKMQMARSVFGFHRKSRSVSVGFGRFKPKKKSKKETEHFSVGFSMKPAKLSFFERVQGACVGVM